MRVTRSACSAGSRALSGRPANGRIGESDAIEILQLALGKAGGVIVHREGGVATVTGHVDVAHLVVQGHAVERQVSLEKAAMGLRFEGSIHVRFRRPDEPRVDPGRNHRQRTGSCVLEYQQARDSLHPGRPAFGRRRDDNVARARGVAVPTATVTRPTSVFA